jgi:hypothetical protein
MSLRRKLMEPLAAVSKMEEDAEDALFLRLRDSAREPGLSYDCTVQGAGSKFVVILSDPASGEHVSAWSGAADGIVVDFQHWLQRRGGVGSEQRKRT